MSLIKQHLQTQMNKEEELNSMKDTFIDSIIDSWDEEYLRQFAYDSMSKYYEDYTEKQFKDMVLNQYGMKELAALMQRINNKSKDPPQDAS